MKTSIWLRTWRRALKETLPYVRKRTHLRSERRSDAMAHAVLAGLPRASDARLHVVKAATRSVGGAVCLFVTHAASKGIKPHVTLHVEQLIGAGISVVLIVNTDVPLSEMSFDSALISRLAACLVRQNLGFDFAAWAHARKHLASNLRPAQLMLVNDSIVGPLDPSAYARLLRRIQSSTADVIGLTENFQPRHHLQSFFLVFNGRALASAAWQRVFDNAVVLPTKELVIDIYETRLTRHMLQAGLICDVMFPTSARSPDAAVDDTATRWEALVEAGFPFIKASVIKARQGDPALDRWVPQSIRP